MLMIGVLKMIMVGLRMVPKVTSSGRQVVKEAITGILLVAREER